MSNFDPFADEAMSADELDAPETGPEATPPAASATERDALLEQLALEQAAERAEAITEKYPALEPFADMLQGADDESVWKLAAELNARVGGEVVNDPHPGNVDPYASLPGDTALDKAKTAARQGDLGPFFALKESAALEAEGKVGRLLTEPERARVRQAADFCRRAGMSAEYRRLLRQLG